MEEPGIDHRQAVDLLDRHPVTEGRGDVEEAERIGGLELLLQELPGIADILREVGHQAEALDLQRADRLLERLPEGPADRHRLAHRLHRRGQDVLGLGEFLEGPAGDLHDAVVDRRLEGGHRLAGDVVRDLVEGVADGELRGDLGDREARRLRGEGRGARHAGVHLDDDHLAGLGMDRELDVGAARLDADLPHDGDGGVAHLLVLDVGEGLGRGDGDRLARVDPHRVDVLDRTDDDDVVGLVAHHLELELLPAEDRLLEHDLVDERGVEAPLGDLGELLAVVGDAAPRAPQGEGGADDDRKPDLGGDGHHLLHRPGEAAFGDLEADPLHRLPEELAVLRLVDDRERGPDHLDAVLLEDAGLRHGDRGVEPGLAAEGGQQGVGPLLGDDLLHRFGGDRLDVGPIRRFGVGHDRRGVGVDEDHLVPLLLQRLAGLGPRVVELAGLADDDRPGADDQDLLDVRPFGHVSSVLPIYRSFLRESGKVFAGRWTFSDRAHPRFAAVCTVTPENLQCAPPEDTVPDSGRPDLLLSLSSVWIAGVRDPEPRFGDFSGAPCHRSGAPAGKTV